MRLDPGDRERRRARPGSAGDAGFLSASRADAERLAALLDGRLDARARAALLVELTTSTDARDALADAAAALRDLERAGHIPATDLPAPGLGPPGRPPTDR